MVAQQLITEIYTSDELKELKTKWKKHGNDRWDDIIQHVFTELYAKPEAFILELQQRGKLKFYIVKMLWNMCHFTKDRFHQSFGRETPTDFCAPGPMEVIRYEETDHEEETRRVNTENRLRTALSEAHWYKARIMELYAELGTYRAVSEATGIPTTSVFRTVNEMKNELKAKL